MDNIEEQDNPHKRTMSTEDAAGGQMRYSQKASTVNAKMGDVCDGSASDSNTRADTSVDTTSKTGAQCVKGGDKYVRLFERKIDKEDQSKKTDATHHPRVTGGSILARKMAGRYENPKIESGGTYNFGVTNESASRQ